jgi:ribosome-binding factor A
MTRYSKSHTYESIKREIMDIFRKLKDPRINDMISIVRMDVAKDCSNCKVYISSLEGLVKAREAEKVLKTAQGHIRRELGRRLPLRCVPEVSFYATDCVEHGMSIIETLNKILKRGAADENINGYS